MDGDRAACRWLEQFNKRRDADHKRNARRNAHTVSFSAKVTDTTTNLSSGPYNYSVTVYAPVTVDASTLPTTASATVPYTGTITASGGSGSGYSWTVTGLSDGLSYTSSGATLTISGTPTSAATVTVTASVKDSAGNAADLPTIRSRSTARSLCPLLTPRRLGLRSSTPHTQERLLRPR